jgi:Fic family protein
MADLLDFVAREDVPVLAQAAVAHAQFESIHPFTDGNGRIGRALINSILRRRRLTTRVVVPLASALVAHRDRYFDALGSYRTGDLEPLIGDFATAARIAASESRTTAHRLTEIPHEWAEMTGPVRAGSAAARMLAMLPAQPILSVAAAAATVGGPISAVYAAVERLRDVGVLRPLTDRKRNQLWGASLILEELDELGCGSLARLGDQASRSATKQPATVSTVKAPSRSITRPMRDSTASSSGGGRSFDEEM